MSGHLTPRRFDVIRRSRTDRDTIRILAIDVSMTGVRIAIRNDLRSTWGVGASQAFRIAAMAQGGKRLRLPDPHWEIEFEVKRRKEKS